MYKILFILTLNAFAAASFAQTKLLLPEKLPENVGDIKFDPKIDDPHFQVCYPGDIYQYYGPGTTYAGGTKAIKNFFFSNFKYDATYSATTGYITIRFVVNCEGKTGRFRVKQINSHYERAQFSKKIVDQLLDLTKKLDHWIPGKANGINCNTYYYLNFKLIKGHLKDITP